MEKFLSTVNEEDYEIQCTYKVLESGVFEVTKLYQVQGFKTVLHYFQGEKLVITDYRHDDVLDQLVIENATFIYSLLEMLRILAYKGKLDNSTIFKLEEI